jgi:stearoyl-CoA desaturase (delta-9 desaturase)
MPPNQHDIIVTDADVRQSEEKSSSESPTKIIRDYPNKYPYEVKPGEKPYKLEIVWRNVVIFLLIHYAAFNVFFVPIQKSTFWLAFLFAIIGSWGIAGGAHRLFAHRSYKANRKLQLLLIFFQTIALQNSCIEWTRDHRAHHKFSDTNADPHNASRGFFFAHMGWLMCKKHPDVRKYGKRISMMDLESDPVLRFQHKFYPLLVLLISLGLPISMSCYIFGESFASAFYMNMFRLILTWHITWSINSFSHVPFAWGGGSKPFEKDILPNDSYIIGILAFGEGWHNFHHVYPWDYKVSELPRYWCNFTIPFIDFFAWLGWATDLKTVSDEMIRRRVLRTGDGSHRYSKKAQELNNNNIIKEDFNEKIWAHEENEFPDTYWGFGDSDIPKEEIKDIKIINKTH